MTKMWWCLPELHQMVTNSNRAYPAKVPGVQFREEVLPSEISAATKIYLALPPTSSSSELTINVDN